MNNEQDLKQVLFYPKNRTKAYIKYVWSLLIAAPLYLIIVFIMEFWKCLKRTKEEMGRSFESNRKHYLG
jgi:hypothetical protein